MQTFSPLHPIRAKRLSWYIKQLKPVAYYPLNEREGTVAYDRSAPKRTSYAVTSITRAGAVATVTTTANHGMNTGQITEISGAVETEYNGQFQITVTGATTFTYAVSGTPNSPATGTILNKRDIQLDGTITGATQGADGQVGKAYSFDGVDDYIIFTGLDPSADSFSIGFLMKRNGALDVSDRIFDQQDSGPTNGWVFDSGGSDNFNFIIKNSTTNVASINSGALTNDVWYFVIGTYEVNSVKLFLNGSQVGSTDTNATMTSATVTPRFGVRATGEANDFKGSAQHIVVLNRVLSAAEILKLARIAGLA